MPAILSPIHHPDTQTRWPENWLSGVHHTLGRKKKKTVPCVVLLFHVAYILAYTAVAVAVAFDVVHAVMASTDTLYHDGTRRRKTVANQLGWENTSLYDYYPWMDLHIPLPN